MEYTINCKRVIARAGATQGSYDKLNAKYGGKVL